MERLIKVVAMIDYVFSVDDDLENEEASNEVEDRIRSGEYFPTDVIDCKLVSVAQI